ncbi:hypothetical protein AXF42_Ash008203 [Apostasia shenzhenica]|uniref:Transcription initiation factor IIA subunit 1 n=1 Tax=Apostasia shenzhenica TaxID=1088818 RepID=A0A2I0A8W2_9ASPA|nr:hypothetical protein AXF42_Ash008203 [Apostasia shenzhenica]
MSSSVSSVYLHVIDDVLGKVREEFVNSGAGESVLNELQAIWEAKMMQCGAISPSMERPSLPKHPGPITPVHDLNVPAVEEYETPTADMLFPPTPLQTPVPQTPIPQTPVQTPLPGMDQMYNIPTGPSDYAPTNDARNGQVTAGRPSPYMDFFMMSSGKRKRDDYAPHLTSGGYMPQQDGSADMVFEFFVPKENRLPSKGLGNKSSISIQSIKESVTAPLLPQQDGVNDDYDDVSS